MSFGEFNGTFLAFQSDFETTAKFKVGVRGSLSPAVGRKIQGLRIHLCASGASFLRAGLSRLQPGSGGQRGVPAGRLLCGILQGPEWQVLLAAFSKCGGRAHVEVLNASPTG